VQAIDSFRQRIEPSTVSDQKGERAWQRLYILSIHDPVFVFSFACHFRKVLPRKKQSQNCFDWRRAFENMDVVLQVIFRFAMFVQQPIWMV
jgi:hypothetical protein